jgi:translation initiation factor 2 beta subunit (eIF-2beta)/eIF-5
MGEMKVCMVNRRLNDKIHRFMRHTRECHFEAAPTAEKSSSSEQKISPHSVGRNDNETIIEVINEQ